MIYQSIKLHWKSFSALSLQTQVWTLKVLLYHRLHQHPLQLYHHLQQDPLNWAAIQTTLQVIDHSYGQLTFPFPPSLMMVNWGSGRAKILLEKVEHFYPFQGTIVISVFDRPWKSKDVWEGVKAFFFFGPRGSVLIFYLSIALLSPSVGHTSFCFHVLTDFYCSILRKCVWETRMYVL